MILRPVRPAVAVGAADHEPAGRVDVPDRVRWRSSPPAAPRGHRARRSSRTSSEVRLSSRCWVETTIAVAADRLAVLVAQRDLALGVGPEAAARAPEWRASASALEDLVGVVDRRRHQLGRLVAGVAEHDALVAGALVLVAGGIDALGDVGRLAVQVARRRRRSSSGSPPARSRCP